LNNGYSNTVLARIFYQTEQTRIVWKFIESTSPETQSGYWKGISPHFWRVPEEDLIFGINKLLEVGRYASALDIVYHVHQSLPTEIIVKVLEEASTHKSEEERRIDSYHLAHILEELENREDVNRGIMLKLEWMYLPLLASYESRFKPKVLYNELSNNPEFFIEVLTWVYKSEFEEKDTENVSDEMKLIRGRNAYELLHSWKQIPGIGEDGSLNEEFLLNWISTARSLAEQTGRLKVADLHLGQVLAGYPEKEEPWPPEEICFIIDMINTDSIKSGFSTATFNKRGLSSRGVFDGGEIERGHAQYFKRQAEVFKYEFPETARLLNQMAKRYELDGRRMDEMAERDQLDN